MRAFVCRNSLNKKRQLLLTRYASNKSCLALTTAVRAFKDAREGIELVSGASDAATRSVYSLAQVTQVR